MKNETTGEWSGVYIDFLEELKRKANFSYSFVINELSSFDDTGDKIFIIMFLAINDVYNKPSKYLITLPIELSLKRLFSLRKCNSQNQAEPSVT